VTIHIESADTSTANGLRCQSPANARIGDIGVSARVSNPRRDAEAAIDLLAETFPRAFFRDAARRQPLKVGVHVELLSKLDGALTPLELRLAMYFYTGHLGYLRACTAGVARIDLDGNAAGSVSALEAAHARARLQAIKARLKARREQQPQPNGAVGTNLKTGKRDGLAELRAAALARKAATT
jgi:sRNA-binding protein